MKIWTNVMEEKKSKTTFINCKKVSFLTESLQLKTQTIKFDNYQVIKSFRTKKKIEHKTTPYTFIIQLCKIKKNSIYKNCLYNWLV